MMLNENNQLYTAEKAAEELGIKYPTFLKLLKEKKIHGIKIGGRWFIHPKTITNIKNKALER